ncbi:MAG: hypothetical protein JWO46_795, partial [Nocardioidaceae bacterium]|nr:hypothetical protein [Nocardioidaceae bacterium]
SRAAAPVDGRISAKALAALDPTTTVLVDQAGVTLDPANADATLARSAQGQTLALTDDAAAQGGPGPTPATDALAMRQRILSEAALRSVDGDANPLVVSLPDTWDPGPDWTSADFFRGLDRPWTRLESLGTGDTAATSVAYPRTAAKAQIDQRQVDSAKEVARAGRVYADALTEPGNLAEAFRRLALEGTSYHARGDASSVRDADDEVRAVHDRLAGIRVVGSPFVTMSGGSGSFVVTLVNDLARPVKIGLAASTSNADLKITAPRKSVVLPAGQRTTVRVEASSRQTGVRAVTLTPVTQDGARVGTPIRFTVRSSQVSSLVWGVMAGAFALLVVTIARRAIKRGLHRDNTPPRPAED